MCGSFAGPVWRRINRSRNTAFASADLPAVSNWELGRNAGEPAAVRTKKKTRATETEEDCSHGCRLFHILPIVAGAFTHYLSPRSITPTESGGQNLHRRE